MLEKNKNNKHLGIIFIIMSAFFFALMALFVKLAGDLPTTQKSFFRNLVAIPSALFVIYKSKVGFKIKKGNFGSLVLRSLFGTIGILFNFYAVDHLLLADASMLNKMSPFFVILFSFLILKEKISLFQLASVIVAFLGSLFVIKPSFNLTEFLPSLIGLLGGLSAGAAYTMVRKLGTNGVKGPHIVLFFSVFSCIATLPFVLFNYQHMTFSQFIMLILAGICATGGQFSVTAAYSHAPASEISIYDYFQIIFSAVLGLVIFRQVPDRYSLLGYVIIVGSAVVMYLYNVKGLFRKKAALKEKTC